MRKCLVLLGIVFYSVLGFAEQDRSVSLDHVEVNLRNQAAIKRGGKFFANVCMACHTLIYLRYDSLAKEAGVIYDKMPLHVTKWPNDIKPPDLSLEVSRRGADWVYTYLHGFYSDPSRPTGTNNLLVHNTGMPDMVVAFQGQQTKVPASELGGFIFHKPHWYDLLEQTTTGSMTPEQFDATVRDVVHFLAYASTPYQVEQENIGYGVVVFLLVLFVLMYLLKRSYWKDLKKSND